MLRLQKRFGSVRAALSVVTLNGALIFFTFSTNNDVALAFVFSGSSFAHTLMGRNLAATYRHEVDPNLMV